SHRASEHVLDTELAGDVFELLGGFGVRTRAAACDDLKSGQGSELAAHFVGDPVSEVVILTAPGAFERKNGKARYSRQARRCGRSLLPETRTGESDHDGESGDRRPARSPPTAADRNRFAADRIVE